MAPLAKCWSSLAALLATARDTSSPFSYSLQKHIPGDLPVPTHVPGHLPFPFPPSHPHPHPPPSFKWTDITPSPDLQFHACFDGFQCARLEIPMDWNSTEDKPEPIALAIVKLPAKVSVSDPRYGGPVLINPGGPGGSGIGLALKEAKPLQTVVDAGHHEGHADRLVPDDSARYYDVLSWDPRGVNNTTPFHTCFTNAEDHKAWSLQSDALLGTPEGSLSAIWARADAVAANCLYNSETNKNGSRIANFATTAMVVRDMVEILEQHGQWREKQAKSELAAMKVGYGISATEELSVLERTRHRAGEEPLHYWGFSYGTILGATFAAMQPHRAQRMILDGVADAEDYYHGGWQTNLQDTDKLMGTFFTQCFAAGKDHCEMFIGDSPADIKAAFDDVRTRILIEGPIVVPATSTRGAEIIQASDITAFLFEILYKPLLKFPKLASVMGPLALHNNGSAFADWKHERHAVLKTGNVPGCDHLDPYNPACYPPGIGEANQAILCGEGDRGVYAGLPKDEFVDYWAQLRNQSEYFGDRWAHIRLACAVWRGQGKWKFEKALASNATKHPVLWIGNTFDPVTPLRNAHKMAKAYEGSVVLQADIEGHCTAVNPSLCVGRAVRKYFQSGELPKEGTVCLPHRRPFVGNGTGVERLDRLPAVLSKDEEALLEALEKMHNP